ncbi:hypothetical protein [Kaarinaea lacus]
MHDVKGKHLHHLLAVSIIGLILNACGGGGDGGQPIEPIPTPTIQTGVFIDSLVIGVYYETETKSGVTNAAGEYQYIDGETVTFSIGGIVLGSTMAAPVVTPVDIVEGAINASDPIVSNIIRLLLTLDADGDASNGLDLTTATAMAVDFSIAIDSPTFEADVTALVESIKGAGATLVDVTTAIAHFDETLHASWGTSVWGGDCWGTVCS